MSAAALPRPHSDRAYWACQFGGWGALTLSQIYVALVFFHLPWQRAALELLTLYGSALVVTHLLRDYMHRHRWGGLSKRALISRGFLASVIVGAPLGVVVNFLTGSVLTNGRTADLSGVGVVIKISETISPLMMLIQHMVNWSGTIGTWMVLYFIIVGVRKRREAELRQSELTRALQLAELRLLKAQLNPHFLFNSLNSVRALIADDPARAQSAVTQLARTLRYTLASGADELATLDQELDIVNDYLNLESLRLGDRLTVERNISSEAMRARIPVMLLQTVVENAIKHGIAELPAGGTLHVSAQVRGGSLLLEIGNPRPAAPSPATHQGIGLRNATERLRLLFGAEASLDLDLSSPAQAVARVRIPVRP